MDDVQAGRGGFLGALARGLLGVGALGWRAAWEAKRAAYATGLRRRRRLPVRVVSVGNLVAGGTGKTPFTAWLAEGLLARGHRPGILSRGYGPQAAGVALSDEGAVLRRLLGEEVPQVEDADRLRGGRRLLAAHPETDVLLLDDGFQHWRLARDADLVLLDATCPFGHGRLLPRGRLREPLRALSRADVLVLTRTERVEAKALAALEARLASLSRAPVAHARTQATQVEAADGLHPPAWLAGRRVHACCGIGNPEAFAGLLADLGAEVVGRRFLGDHAAPGAGGWEAVVEEGKRLGADLVLTTRKDAVKAARRPEEVAVLDARTTVTQGEEEIWAAVEAAR